MISCKKAVELLSKEMEEPLSKQEKKELLIHLHICEFCVLFQKQLNMIRLRVREFFGMKNLPKTLPSSSKEKIREMLKARKKRL